jgi:GNAT superfamily N-acetyltransferase
MFIEVHRDSFTITTDPGRIDLDAVHHALAHSYWSEAVPRRIVRNAIEHSLCFSLFDGTKQIGFARVVTDRATFGYLCDVYILDAYQRRRLGHWLMETVMSHPDLQELRRFNLVTRDAHHLYADFGFVPLAAPERHMEKVRPGMYVGMNED